MPGWSKRTECLEECSKFSVAGVGVMAEAAKCGRASARSWQGFWEAHTPGCIPELLETQSHRRALRSPVTRAHLLFGKLSVALAGRTGVCSCGFVSISCCCEHHLSSGNSFASSLLFSQHSHSQPYCVPLKMGSAPLWGSGSQPYGVPSPGSQVLTTASLCSPTSPGSH